MNTTFPRIRRIVPVLFAFLSLVHCLRAESIQTEDSSPLKNLQLPGISIEPAEGIVDVEAQVTLTDGLLELIACTKGTKEHESILAILASPLHVHTALLLIGARNGTPAMRRPANEELTHWIHYRPTGDSIAVSLLFEGPDGIISERPISDFIKRTESDAHRSRRGDTIDEIAEDEAAKKFPDVFLFTGSHLLENKDGTKQYLADTSGHAVTISTFGDELLGLADIQSHANGELIWEVDATHLPPMDSKVTLRLRLHNRTTE